MCTITALLVCFNPDPDELQFAINCLLNQTHHLVLCNNSNNGYVYETNSPNERLTVFNFSENLGIAKAQSIGMKWAFENGADFVLQMDQDSIPHEDMTRQLIHCFEELTAAGYNVGLVGVQDYDRVTKEVNKARVKKGHLIRNGYFDVDSTLSSGSLIPKKAYEAIGGMRDDLFIDAVDHEYCWRLRFNGFKVIRNCNALLAHRLGDGKFKILNLVSVGMPSPFRHYYATRNIFLLLKEKHVPLFWKISSLVKLAGKVVCYPVFLPKGKDRLCFFIKGIRDGMMGRSGIIK